MARHLIQQPAVVLVDGDEASGLATMLADLLESNIDDFRSRRAVASLARGDVAFGLADRRQSVTLSFRPGVVEVSDGSQPGVPTLTAPWLAMAKVCSGTLSPWAAWRAGELQFTPVHRGRVAVASWVLSVPAAFYADADDRAALLRRRRTRVAMAVGVSLVVAVAALEIRRRRR